MSVCVCVCVCVVCVLAMCFHVCGPVRPTSRDIHACGVNFPASAGGQGNTPGNQDWFKVEVKFIRGRLGQYHWSPEPAYTQHPSTLAEPSCVRTLSHAYSSSTDTVCESKRPLSVSLHIV